MDKFIKNLLQNEGYLCYLDYHFAKFATGLSGKENGEILLAAALVSKKTREGHICINLDDYDDIDLVEGKSETHTPKLEEWLEKIKGSAVIGKPGEVKPLILDEKNRLYLYRYWAYEYRIANNIKNFVEDGYAGNGIEDLPSRLDVLFPANGKGSKNGGFKPDLQKLAAFTAVIKKMAVISGGPGTGKTTTVAKILALLIHQAKDKDIKIRLAAPTGKAAARLQESIKNFKSKAKAEGLKIKEEILEKIPEEASTIHRLLGSLPNSPYFRHNSKNSLSLDVLVVDEASMIDVPLMAKLLEALPEHARLIILGDKDQLSSVEAGKFMGDVCTGALKSSYSHGFHQAIGFIIDDPNNKKVKISSGSIKKNKTDELSLFGEENVIPVETLPETLDEKAELNGITIAPDKPSLRDCFIHLTESYRFNEKSGIGSLSKLVNEGKNKEAAELLHSRKFSDILMKDISSERLLAQELKNTAAVHYEKYLSETDPKKVFELFDQFRVLCAMREGPFGVKNINQLIESILFEKKAITGSKKDWYQGMPVMITQNNYSVNLFNGDVGIVLQDKESNNKLKAFFPASDGTFRKFHQLRLPEYEKVFAMTVHKSQGSEFDNVVLILPDRPAPVLTRELLYTGLTRAKSNVEIWSSNEIFNSTIEANIRRSSGLYDALKV